MLIGNLKLSILVNNGGTVYYTFDVMVNGEAIKSYNDGENDNFFIPSGANVNVRVNGESNNSFDEYKVNIGMASFESKSE